jgi:serine/threonine-protein kinase
MAAPSQKPLRDHAMSAACNDPGAGMRTAMCRLLLALILVYVASVQPASARVVVKKGVYGAIALQRETGQLGYAYNAATSRAAKIEALNQCAHPRCEVVASFSNACGALARGPKKYFSATGATRQEAEAKALRLCSAKDCELAAWACTK